MADLTDRIEALEDRLTGLEQRRTATVGGITNADLNNAVANGIRPHRQRVDGLEDRILALEAIVKAYRMIFLAHGVKTRALTSAVKASTEQLTRNQQRIAREILRSG